MKTRLIKIFSFLSFACGALSLSLMLIRGYLGDNFFQITQDFFPPVGRILHTDKNDYSFAVASDTGSNNLVLQSIINAIRKSDKNYEFILYLGDLITDKPKSHLYWMTAEIKPKLKHLPFYMVPGNHDVYKKTKVDKKPYKAIFGPEYYWFGYGEVLFIAMDSSEEKIDDAQLEWLSQTLTRIRPAFKSCIIYGHVPPRDENFPEKTHTLDKISTDKFENILKKHDIDLLLFGHVHYFSETTFAGIPAYTAPSAGQRIRGGEKHYGYIGVTIKSDELKSIEPHYIKTPKAKREKLDVFLVQNVLSTRVRRTSLSLFGIGIVFYAVAALLRRRASKSQH